MGNIGGNVLANALRNDADLSWMWNIRSIGILVGVFGIINLLLLIDHPAKVKIVIDPPTNDEKESIVKRQTAKFDQVRKGSSDSQGYSELEDASNENTYRNYDSIVEVNVAEAVEEEAHGISFWKAWLLPGVIPFAVCIAFVKLSTYGMLFWLPTYAKEELGYSHEDVELIAISFDVGTIIGSILLGLLSDLLYKKRSPVAYIGLVIGSVLFLLVVFFADSSKFGILALIFFVGFIVGGVFNIVAATAAADLAKGDSLKGNDKALATVSGILDGSGSLGAAFGSLIIGEIARKSWNGVFIFLA